MNTLQTIRELEAAALDTSRDLWRVWEYFYTHTGTTLDCAFDTGILRNCITVYVIRLEERGLIEVMYKAKDRRTGWPAKHYSSDPEKWKRRKI